MAGIKKSIGVSARSTRHFLGKRVRKVSFSAHYKGTSRRGRIFAAMAVVGLLLFGSGLFISFFTYVRSSCIDYSAPFLRLVYRGTTAVDKMKLYVADALELMEDPTKYQGMRLQKEVWEARSRKLAYENQRLKKTLNLKQILVNQEYDFKLIGQVVAQIPHQYGRMVIISGGEPQGILPKDIIVEEKGLVGQVFDGGKKISRGLLLTDPRSRIPIILDPSGYQGIMSGDYSDFPLLSRLETSLSSGEDLNEERVYTSGVGGVFYGRIPIGKVFKDRMGVLRVKPDVDFSLLDVVGILEALPSDAGEREVAS